MDKMRGQERECKEEEVFVRLNEFDGMKKSEKKREDMFVKKEKETYARLK